MLSTFARVVNRHTHTLGCLPGCRAAHQHIAACPKDCRVPDVVTRIKLPCEVCGRVRVLGLDGTCGPCWYAFLAIELGISGEDWFDRVRDEVAVRQARRPNSRYIEPSTPAELEDGSASSPARMPAAHTVTAPVADTHHSALVCIRGMPATVDRPGTPAGHKEGGPPLHDGPPNELATPTTEPTTPTAVTC